MSPKLREVVDFFIIRSEQAARPLTNKKLQKLIYYAQAWSMVFNNEPLFNEKIEAWIHGPVVPEVYDEYKKYGREPISEKVEFDDSLFSEGEKDTLNKVWDIYGGFDGDYLEILTHSEDPWITARGEAEANERSTSEIRLDAMRSFYSAKNIAAMAAEL